MNTPARLIWAIGSRSDRAPRLRRAKEVSRLTSDVDCMLATISRKGCATIDLLGQLSMTASTTR